MQGEAKINVRTVTKKRTPSVGPLENTGKGEILHASLLFLGFLALFQRNSITVIIYITFFVVAGRRSSNVKQKLST